ncbi:nucleotide disphospho-sugar-binding domain-containing protein [Gulosibacter sp. 10]|uniref:glycosyltransferase n=1 Tax=Gulosibacter sp. 10 TaxID=1255570 RepID=UPI00097EE7C5|nr:nucleotide disphospho-sugar-binding domain-containing protein [Gulosibacter sp. 10]SJM58100.1 putative glycosyl transferase [Gulosibacter sp. 10]
MAAILFGAVMFNLAEVTRMIEVARAIDRRHTAVFFGYEEDYRHLVETAGFEYRALSPAWTPAQRRQALRFDQAKTLRNPFTAPLVAARVAAERELIRETGAEAVVIGTNVTSMISARAEGATLWYAVPFALTRPHVEQTRRLGLVRGDGMPARTLDALATRAFRWAYGRAPLAPRAFSRVARANGVRPLKTIVSLLEADRNLLTVMPGEFEGYALPEGYERVGPIFAHLDAPLPGIVHELAEREEPLVYLGLGSSADRGMALAAARRLGALPVNVLAPIRHYLRPDDVLPANVHVTDLLPAHRLGGLVDAAVLHGGQGTVQTACATGIPFVGMGLQPEQAWNVRVCAARGNAIALSPRAAGTRALSDAVRRLLSDSSFRRTAEKVRREYAGEDGAAACARRIEAALGS